MSEVDINADFTQTHRIVKYSYSVAGLQLHTSAVIYISLVDSTGNQVYNMQKLLIGEEYDAWGADDSYISVIADIEVRKLVTPVIPEPVV